MNLVSQIRVPVRVKPGASRARVGGRFGDDQLIVAVSAPPVDGAANDAVVAAVAKAVGVRPRHVSIVTGHTSRSKIVAIDVPEAEVNAIRDIVNTLLA